MLTAARVPQGVVEGCKRDLRSKTSYGSWFWQASSTEQLDQTNLIIFYAYIYITAVSRLKRGYTAGIN